MKLLRDRVESSWLKSEWLVLKIACVRKTYYFKKANEEIDTKQIKLNLIKFWFFPVFVNPHCYENSLRTGSLRIEIKVIY